ncbi:MAG: hypothetical protein IJ789_04710 [Bacteroidales bacterium]|nr:hypothetical protein [Bacteroidales bacterium]MBR1850658.1 hypothetical protein [Bacteroidales bacterium]
MQRSSKTKIITIVSAVVIVALATFVFFRFCFVYSTGVNAGDLNYFQKEGVVFKTYEGKVIQSGFKSAAGVNRLQSNEFKFSVTDKAVADTLMRASGKHVELRWKRYLGTLPWRGNSQYVVCEVMSIAEINPQD